MVSINTNLSSLIAQNSLKSSTNKLNTAVERMSTGYKINHAKDNAANYSISTNMTTKIGAYMVAEDNALQGLDMINTASESLSLIEDKLMRLRALATQASNDTYGVQSKQAINDIAYSYASPMVVIGSSKGEYRNINNKEVNNSAIGMVSSGRFSEGLSNDAFVKSQYDVIYGSYPDRYDELALVVSSTNELTKSLLDSLQIEYKMNLDGSIDPIKFSDLVTTEDHVGKTYKLIYNNERFTPVLNGSNEIVDFEEDYNAKTLFNDPNAGLTLKISGVFRVKPDAAMSMYSNGLIYTPMLTEHFKENAKQSTIVNMQKDVLEADPNATFYNKFKFVVQNIPFEFENGGTRVIHYSPETYMPLRESII